MAYVDGGRKAQSQGTRHRSRFRYRHTIELNE